MKTKILLGICIILLIVPLASALQTNYERTAVARIVGDSPDEMKQQLVRDELNIQHASYYADDELWDETEEKVDIIENKVPDNTIRQNLWSWNTIDNDMNKWEENELFIIEDEGDVIKDVIYSGGHDPLDFEWKNEFKAKSPLFVFDSEYAGLYLPNKQGFVKELGQDSVMVAPNSYASREFVRSFLCNLGKYDNLGEVYRQARNNYYWGVDTEDEFVGLTMLSYELLGNPNINIQIPHFNENEIKKYCDNYLNEYDAHNTDLLFSIMGPDSEPLTPGDYTGKYVFNVEGYDVKKDGDFEILEVDKMNLNYAFDELVLPKQVIVNEFPLKTVIKNVTLVKMEDPVELTVDLPMWEGEIVNGTPVGEFLERICFSDTQDAGMTYSHSFTEDKEAVLVTINPVEVVNCTTGKIKLYQHIVYNIDYLPYSDVLIHSIDYDPYSGPEDNIELEVWLKNIRSYETSGNIYVKDQDGNLISRKNVELHSAELNSVDISFDAPSDDGKYKYQVVYFEDEIEHTYTNFDFQVNSIYFEYGSMPSIIERGELVRLPYYLKKNIDEKIQVDVNYYLYSDDKQIDSGGISLSVDQQSPYEKEGMYLVNIFDHDPGSYTIVTEVKPIIVIGSDAIEMTRYSEYYALPLIIRYSTPKAPQFRSYEDLTVYEGEIVRMKPDVVDLNGDQITIIYPPPFRVDGTWQTKEGDKGSLGFDIIATDGRFNTTAHVPVTVLDNSLKSNRFSDDNSSKVLTYYQPGQKTVYIKVLKKAEVNSASFKIEGYSTYANP